MKRALNHCERGGYWKNESPIVIIKTRRPSKCGNVGAVIIFCDSDAHSQWTRAPYSVARKLKKWENIMGFFTQRKPTFIVFFVIFSLCTKRQYFSYLFCVSTPLFRSPFPSYLCISRHFWCFYSLCLRSKID